MAIIKSTRDWQGVTVEERINTETGQIEIFAPPGKFTSVPLKLAETFQDGDKNKWRFTNEERYRTFVNNARQNAGQAGLTSAAFNKSFFTDGAPLFNNDRAATLNNNDNYSSQAEARTAREAFFDSNIPLIVSPKTGQQVSSLGVKTTQQITGQQPAVQPASTPLGPGIDQSQETDEAAVYGRSRPGGGNKEQLRYPLNISGPFTYDFISITAYDYKPSGLEENYAVDKNIYPGQQYETVILPMQPQLSETNGVSWSEDQLNPVQKALGNAAIKTIQGLGTLDVSKIGDAVMGLAGNLKDVLGDPATKQYVAAYFAGQAVGANLVGRTSGMVINPNLELLFNGPNLRLFNFNFSLTPRSPKESEECRKIIRAFKRNMAVSRTSSNLFLRSPRIFKLKYIFKDGKSDHPYLNKFKPCALTNFAVNYTPDGSYSTFDSTGSMTQYNLDMTFSEVMPIYSEDIPADKTTTMGF